MIWKCGNCKDEFNSWKELRIHRFRKHRLIYPDFLWNSDYYFKKQLKKKIQSNEKINVTIVAKKGNGMSCIGLNMVKVKE